MIKDVRELNMQFQKGGSGSITTRLCIPKTWSDKLGITKGKRVVVVTLEDDEIRIKKKECWKNEKIQ